MQKSVYLDKVLHLFIAECQKCNLQIDKEFAYYLVTIHALDAREGLELHRLNDKRRGGCKTQLFLENLLKKYVNPLDATMCIMKVAYFLRNCRELNVDYVKEKYEQHFKIKLHHLIEDILQYPETSNKEQIDGMFLKMQVFIIACYNLGDPKNHVLLKQARQSLNSVIGRGDLQNFVHKKKHHRLEYLQRLSATVCGIMIFNNMSPDGEKENMRDICQDLKMAQQNTKTALETMFKKINECGEYGDSSIKNVIQLDVEQQKAYCYVPIERAREINKFIILFVIYKRHLKNLLEIYAKTEYLISVGLGKVKCVMDKINDVLKFRTAIQSEIVFPHFVYLSEVWQTLVLYLNHLAEINKIRDTLESIVSADIEATFVEMLEQFKEKKKDKLKPNEFTFEELMIRTNKNAGYADLLKIKSYTGDYCCLTLALTNGLIVPSYLQKKLCENLKMRFGFSDIDYAKYAERHFEDFIKTFKNAVFTSIDAILLFDLETDIINWINAESLNEEPKRGEIETQTEMVIVNDLSVPNWINVTWNKWDFHRETVRLANIRQRQTNSQQSLLTFGKRNAKDQAYHTRKHR